MMVIDMRWRGMIRLIGSDVTGGDGVLDVIFSRGGRPERGPRCR